MRKNLFQNYRFGNAVDEIAFLTFPFIDQAISPRTGVIGEMVIIAISLADIQFLSTSTVSGPG